jgi:sugar transferase EpsL
MKRSLDLILAISTILIFLPILFLISILILSIDGRPVFYTQKRIGKNSETFNIIKFRTMMNNVKISDEKRVTKLGSFLRKTSIDELPNLLNVISGKMSIVGPRPLPATYLNRFDDYQARRHNVKPGLTGWAQINGRNLNTWEKKFELDIWYVNNKTLLVDIKIIFLTFITIISQKGINDSFNRNVKEFKNQNKNEYEEKD